MRRGDIVEYAHGTESAGDRRLGIILNASVMLPIGETMPSMVEVLWYTGDVETIFTDEIMVLQDNS